ncbi:MAG: hypothetical protein KGN74_03475 [Gemmatimonadota bacterium]|nr:hypothetical protein [Gemmatimonadota bacterium]
MNLPRSSRVVLFLAATAVVGAGACSDNLESNAACPSLCPGQAVTLRDTTVDAVVLDTTVSGFPAIGQENYLLISTRGDTIDTRGIFRFDSLPTTYRRGTALVDSAISGVDSAYFALRRDTSLAVPGGPITISVYDVDTGNQDSTATDTAVAALAPLFSPDRLLGYKTFAPDSLGADTIKVPISDDSLFAYIKADKRLRVGVQVTGARGAQIRVGTVQSLTPAAILFKPAPHGDTTGVTVSNILPLSMTPINSPLINDLSDFLLVVKGTPKVQQSLLQVGGLPGKRVYLRFDLPSAIVDSSTVVRATLLLNQIPNPISPDAHDTTGVWPQAILASSAVTDLSRALRLLAAAGAVGVDTLERFSPADGGERSFEMVQLIRAWHTNLSATDPRALAIRSQLEGSSGAEYLFTPSSGPLALRPRVHIVYTPHVITGSTP